jgi:Putative peptidoglycan binding domain
MKNQDYVYFIFSFIFAIINIEIINNLDINGSIAIAQQNSVGWIADIEGTVLLDRPLRPLRKAVNNDDLFDGDILRLERKAKVKIKCRNNTSFNVEYSVKQWSARSCLASPRNNFSPAIFKADRVPQQTIAFTKPIYGGDNSPQWFTLEPICSPIMGNICLGKYGQDVIFLQQDLQQLGLFRGNVDGYYSFNTRDAVVQLQQLSGLETTGFVDLRTLQALKEMLAASPRPKPKYGNYIGYPPK